MTLISIDDRFLTVFTKDLEIILEVVVKNVQTKSQELNLEALVEEIMEKLEKVELPLLTKLSTSQDC